MGLTRPRAYQIFDLDYKQSVRVVTVSNVTLSGGAPNQVDGVNLTLNDRILVTGQSTGSQNGLYYVTTVGTGSNGTWARTVDGNETGEIEAGMIIMVTEGTVYADTQWKLTTNDPIVVGTTALTFVQNYSANSVSSGTSNVAVQANSNVSIAVAGSNIVVYSTGTENITANIIPTANVTYNLGNATNRFKDLYLSNNSIFLGNVTLSANSSALSVNGSTVLTSTTGSTLSLAGNVTGGNIISVGNVDSTGGNFTGNVAIGNVFVGGYYWANGVVFAGGGGGGGTPGGANTQIQFNDNGVFGGSPGLTFNKTTNAVATTGTFSATGNITGGNVSGTGLTGTLLTASQTNITSVGTLGSLSVTGNITSGNVSGTRGAFTNIAGTLETASQTNITSVGTLGSLSVTGNVQGGNLRTAGLISATGAITGAAITGSSLTVSTGNITAGNLNISGGIVDTGALTVVTGSNGNVAITPNGTGILTVSTAASVTGNIDGGNLRTAGLISATGQITGSQFNGSGAGLTSIPGGNVTGTVATATTAGTVTTNSQPNITSVGTLSSLTVTGNIDGGNLRTAGLISATGAVTGSSFTGAGTGLTGTASSLTVGTATTAGTVTTAAQPNITSVGTLSSLSVTGNITSGNVSGTNLTGTLLTAAQTNVTSVGTLSSLSVTGNVQGGNLRTDGLISATGAITGGAITGSSLTVSTGSVTAGNIVNANANGVGNIGSATTYFNTVFAKATSAQYADLAEMYVADAEYEPGTIVEFGGEREVTITTTSHSTSVAGIVSTNPSYLMNSTQTGEYVLPIALTGRVPCRVQGPVRKGDVLVSSSTPGVAQRIGMNWQPGCVVGKSMEIIPDNSIQTIEVAVGRL